MRSYGYKFAGYFMEYGPIQADSLDEAKARVRERLGTRRLPPGIQVWDLSHKPLEVWRVPASASA